MKGDLEKGSSGGECYGIHDNDTGICKNMGEQCLKGQSSSLFSVKLYSHHAEE